jgi:hypothetical protein
MSLTSTLMEDLRDLERRLMHAKIAGSRALERFLAGTSFWGSACLHKHTAKKLYKVYNLICLNLGFYLNQNASLEVVAKLCQGKVYLCFSLKKTAPDPDPFIIITQK